MHVILHTATFAAATMLLSAAALSGDKRQLDSHEHGLTVLNVAIEDDTLVLELEGPAMNFVGFEYAARTDEQKKSVNDTLAVLDRPEQLFRLDSSAGCTLANATTALVTENAAGSDADHSDHDGHDDHADHDNHDDDHDAHEDHSTEASHSEFRADYTYRCAKTDELNELQVALFERFPLTNEIEVSAIGPSMQTFKALTKNDPVIKLTP